MQPAGRPAVRILVTADQGEADEFTARGRVERLR